MTPSKVLRSCLFVFLACGAAGCGSSNWQPAPALLAQLDEPTEIGGFTIRPPKDYTGTIPPKTPEQFTVLLWHGDRREDNSAPTLAFAMLTYQDASASLESYLDTQIPSTKRGLARWSQTDAERGAINGVPALRLWFRGERTIRAFPTGEPQTVKIRGFIYVLADGARRITLSSQDVEPYADAALKLAEASVLTLKKK